MDALVFLAAPIVMAILMVGIHAYLGLHVLEREVIFVDISLSQIAALGGALALNFAGEQDGLMPLGFSLALCLFVALALSFFRAYEKRISQEAIIGITYAFASGALILAVDRLPHGIEHIKETLVGNILYVTWPHVLTVAVVYGLIGLLHYVFRRPFWACSRGEGESLLWDFLFYFLFGVVITFSTHHAGVLVVFSILVVPGALAKSLFRSLRSQLFAAWAIGVSGVLAAFALSYGYDFPAGAAIVTTLTAGFFVVLTGRIAIDRIRGKIEARN